MTEEKNTYRYYLKQRDGKVVYAGFTYDPVRREAEHVKDYPGARMVLVGKRVTWKIAQRWLESQERRLKLR